MVRRFETDRPIAPASTGIVGLSQLTLPTEAERVALGQSGPLLRYASENIANLDPELALVIAEAHEAWHHSAWTAETSKRFWCAFNRLCTVSKPVTTDTLSALYRNLPRTRWLWWLPRHQESMAARSSRRYTRWLVFLLVVIVPLQLLIWIYSNLGNELEKATSELNNVSADLFVKCTTLGKVVIDIGGKPHQWTPDQLADLDAIHARESELRERSLRSLGTLNSLQTFMLPGFGREALGALPTPGPPPQGNDWYQKCLFNIDNTKPIAVVTLVAQSRLTSGILLQFVLPILLASIGALAYVLRNTSEQIKSSTFSTTSTTRNLVRITLGALMGVVIGLFSGVSDKISLPPLALAFLAGYGVEAVFGMFDGLIERFREK